MPDRTSSTTYPVTSTVTLTVTATDPTENQSWTAPKLKLHWDDDTLPVRTVLIRPALVSPVTGNRRDFPVSESHLNAATADQYATRRFDEDTYHDTAAELTHGLSRAREELKLNVEYVLLDTHDVEAPDDLLDAVRELNRPFPVPDKDQMLIGGSELLDLPHEPR